MNYRNPSDFLSREKCVEFCNLVTGVNPLASDVFWRETVVPNVVSRFGQIVLQPPPKFAPVPVPGSPVPVAGGAASPVVAAAIAAAGAPSAQHESDIYALRTSDPDLIRLVRYVCDTVGVRITSPAWTGFLHHPCGFELNYVDVQELGVR